jgi:hypothetical protein
MIRYGGIYARRRKIDKKLHRAISREKLLFTEVLTNGAPPSFLLLVMTL